MEEGPEAKGEMCNCKCFCQIVLSHHSATCGFCLSLSLLMRQGSISLDSICKELLLLLLLLQEEMQEFSVQLFGFVVKVMMLLVNYFSCGFDFGFGVRLYFRRIYLLVNWTACSIFVPLSSAAGKQQQQQRS